MSTFYNNIIINKNSPRFQPFLLNLLSGRRRLLSIEEFNMIQVMMQTCENVFNQTERDLFELLCQEKQLITDNERKIIEIKMMESNFIEMIFLTMIQFYIGYTNATRKTMPKSKASNNCAFTIIEAF